MLRQYPDTLRWRQALPPLFVLSLISLSLVSIFLPIAGLVLAGELIVYFSVMMFTGLYTAFRQRKSYLMLGLVLAIPVMHVAWGGGFLWSILTTLSNKK